ncbi:MAG: cation:proton antiporter family protein [Pseudomonadota bacterium]
MIDPIIIVIALICGLLARSVGLPALIGYLAAGFVLHEANIEGGSTLRHLADLGVTLLLFTIGLKLQLPDLLKTRIWATTVIHMAIMQCLFLVILWVAGQIAPGLGLNISTMLVIAFALTFSSTVFVIQVMQERGEMASHHANIAIGILVIQDLAAVIFLAASTGKVPEPFAVALLLLIPLRRYMLRLLTYAGHGELFTLFGLALALGGAQLFESVGIKGDLGALLIGALLAGDQKSKELSRNLLQFKDLFLVGFFLTIGLGGWPGGELVILALLIGLLAILKPLLYFPLLTLFHTPPRTAILASGSLANFSEFGLIVIAVAVQAGWLEDVWGAAMSLVIAVSFIISSQMSRSSHEFYWRYRDRLRGFESTLVRDTKPNTEGIRVLVLGMGNIGTGAYDLLAEHHGGEVAGIDVNERKLANHRREHRRVIAADASDPELWHWINLAELELVMLALTNHQENLLVVELLNRVGYQGKLAAVVRFSEEGEDLEAHGVSVFNLYAQAGAGFAEHASSLVDGLSAGYSATDK